MKSQGFTLIELIIILVIIGILAVSAAPVFFDSSGTQNQVLRQQAMSILRSIQLQAMQDTQNCYVAAVSQNTLGQPLTTDNNCSNPKLPSVNQPPSTDETNRQIRDSEGVEFSLSGASPDNDHIGFDGLGRPVIFIKAGDTAVEERRVCLNEPEPCILQLTETSGANRNICINREGYIYEC
ncbi:prepilin-type N-terminal cleavage/methylation domain-containing protein [Idiomarina loihiensis]|uniref:prepilin-type N-terminal cleavage/methylation domain-containing protein n=1 Tax=Idiomarina loihiensis TaxID=135577 RepID=UPI003850F9AE